MASEYSVLLPQFMIYSELTKPVSIIISVSHFRILDYFHEFHQGVYLK
jgi:hypothetical protein